MWWTGSCCGAFWPCPHWLGSHQWAPEYHWPRKRIIRIESEHENHWIKYIGKESLHPGIVGRLFHLNVQSQIVDAGIPLDLHHHSSAALSVILNFFLWNFNNRIKYFHFSFLPFQFYVLLLAILVYPWSFLLWRSNFKILFNDSTFALKLVTQKKMTNTAIRLQGAFRNQHCYLM